mmetsp:Transcript_17938/g.34291  ORF Transcript_17938/g.34291 Transcript_17938/m.34291 type:complete len:481 (-) Transcript_17938:167-1609(-)
MVNGIRVDLPVEESGDSLLSPNTRRLSHLLSFSRMQLSLGWKTKETHVKEERDALAKFKREIARHKLEIPSSMVYAADHDATLMRFLRARKLKVDASMEMLKETLEWRDRDNVNQVLAELIPDWKLAVIRKHSRGAQLGFDKMGRPVYLDRPGFLDVEAIIKEGVSPDDFLRKHIRDMEYVANELMWQASLERGHTVDQTLTVIDATDIKISSLTKTVRETFGKITQIDQKHYPETLGATIILNAGWVFSSVFKVVATFLDPRTRAKIQVLGSGKKDVAVLEEFLDLNQIPTFIGGHLREEDVWDKGGVTAEDRRLDLECKRRHRLMEDGATLEEVNIPWNIRQRAERGTLRCATAQQNAAQNMVGMSVSISAMVALQSQYTLLGQDGHPLDTGDARATPAPHTSAETPPSAKASTVVREVLPSSPMAELPSLEQLGFELDVDVREALETLERILAKCRILLKEKRIVQVIEGEDEPLTQ